ncbi:YceD family protein [Sphingobacterium sp. LRF_L2]|uniref:YceD family protein n=1 Tax=Sphingobacterium sp. LRF_L2 TaxID=3369421 RepID=UPI003F5EFFDC
MQISKYLKQYRIPFSGLSRGKHEFEFEIEDKFFDCYEHSLVKKGTLQALVSLQKQENMLVVNFHITGMIQLTCDVCLTEFDSPVEFEERVLVKFSEDDWADNTEEVLTLSKTDYELDIAELLYEYINVRVPYYSKCSEQGIGISCDPEMLAKLSNETETTEEENTEEKIDPRWDILKNIKNN